jgi:Dioxygenase
LRKELIMMRVNHRETDLENHDRGLDYDLPRLLQRRGMLKLVAGVGLTGAGLITLGACGTVSTPGEASSSSGSRPARPPGGGLGGGAPESTQTTDTANGELPEETGGPFPGDGSNGANVLNQSGIVRRDITSSFGSSTTKAEGVPLSITMTINDYADNKAPLAGGAVYVWHCDREGKYSLYSQGVTGENYLRGVQETDKRGQVRFTTIFPAVTRAGGHTSTSRSIPAWRRRQTARTRSPHRRLPCPRPLVRRSTRLADMNRASATWAA